MSLIPKVSFVIDHGGVSEETVPNLQGVESHLAKLMRPNLILDEVRKTIFAWHAEDKGARDVGLRLDPNRLLDHTTIDTRYGVMTITTFVSSVEPDSIRELARMVSARLRTGVSLLASPFCSMYDAGEPVGR